MDRSLRAYLDDVSRQERLDAEATRELFRARARPVSVAQSRALEDRIYRGNLWLVVGLVRRWYSTRGVPVLDLIQEGNIGLGRAIQRYDVERHVAFSTYAAHRIRREVSSATNSALSPVSGLHPRKHPQSAFANQRSRPAATFGAEAVEDPIALLADPRDLEAEVGSVLAAQRMSTMLDKLTPRLRVVVESRLLMDPTDADAYTQREIAWHLGVSKQRVQQFEHRARQLLAAMVETPYCVLAAEPDRSSALNVARFQAAPRLMLRRQRALQPSGTHCLGWFRPPRPALRHYRLVYRVARA